MTGKYGGMHGFRFHRGFRLLCLPPPVRLIYRAPKNRGTVLRTGEEVTLFFARTFLICGVSQPLQLLKSWPQPL